MPKKKKKIIKKVPKLRPVEELVKHKKVKTNKDIVKANKKIAVLKEVGDTLSNKIHKRLYNVVGREGRGIWADVGDYAVDKALDYLFK